MAARPVTHARDAHWLITDAPELIPAAAAAEVTGLDWRTVVGMAERGELGSVRTPGRLLIKRQALLDLLDLARAIPA